MSILKLPSCGKNTGVAYTLQSIIGDCFCPKCHKIIYPEESKVDDYFIAHCVCGAYIRTYIEVTKDGKYGKWKYIDYEGEEKMKINVTIDCNDFFHDFLDSEDFDQWIKKTIKDEILKRITKSDEWKELIDKKTQQIFEGFA